MFRGEKLEEQVYEPEHIQQVLAEIERNFPGYFKSFAQRPLERVFDKHVQRHKREQEAYRDILDLKVLDEFEHDPNAFKSEMSRQCPIIRRCLMSQDEVMKQYKVSFRRVAGRQLLDTVRRIAEFGISYVKDFDDEEHENVIFYSDLGFKDSYSDLGLKVLNEEEYHLIGVIGYGIQSSLLYGLYPRNFAHRSQDAVWSLYFLSGRKDFGLLDGSEFLMVHPDAGTCEQNYFYPAELFGFYALKVYMLLKSACKDLDLTLQNRHRYIYLSRFCDHVANTHRKDINTFRRSSDYVESQPWF
jgi:hypothetical protein